MKVTEMNQIAVSVDASNTLGIDHIAMQQKVSALTSAQQSDEMRERIGRLSVEASVWESEAYAHSNAILYGLLQKAYGLYLDLTTNADGNLKYRKQGLADYLSLNGLDSYKDKLLPQKIVVCVFGKRDRRRLSTYQLVLRHIIAQAWALSEVPTKIAEAGGVQEISLGRPSGGLTTKEKAALAGARVSQEVLATLHSEELSRQFNPEATGEQFAAVLTQEADGSFSVHCVVKSATAVNSALAAYFAANKDDLKRGVDEHQAARTQASVAELNDAAVSHKLAA